MQHTTLSLCTILTAIALSACGQTPKKEMNNTEKKENKHQAMLSENRQVATFGAGCFWCVEAIFQDLKGVDAVVSGYSGGHVENPSYKEVTSGNTGHAEVCQITFDPAVISFDELLEVFWQTHDPTTLNRQGNDVGTQYRSAVFYHNDEQMQLATTYKEKLNASGAWDNPVVTEIVPFKSFYKAEDYHQNYFNLNGEQPYCSFVIQPKVEKFRKVFKEKLSTKSAE